MQLSSVNLNGVVLNSPAGDFVNNSMLAIEAPVLLSSPAYLSQPLKIGAFTYQCSGGLLNNVEVGRYCSLATNVYIGCGQHPTVWLSSSPVQYLKNLHGWDKFLQNSLILDTEYNPYSGHTKIGNDVWIGINSYIKEGLVIGDGAIIGACSVVTKDVPPYAIVAGNPAKILRFRFPDDIIEKLLRLKWWNYKYTDFDGVKFNNIESAIEQISERIECGKIQKYSPYIMTEKELYDYCLENERVKDKTSVLEHIFSIRNKNSHKIITIAGAKIKIKR